MKKWVRLAARLYPAQWRQRYGAEFDALLDDTECRRRDVVDVFCGAMMMQIATFSYRNTAVATGLAGLILATGFAFLLPNRYVSRAIVHLNWAVINESAEKAPLHPGDAWNDKIHQLTNAAFSRSALASIIQRPDLDLYRKERTQKPLEDVVEQMRRKDIQVEVRHTNGAAANIVVAFMHPDPVIAQKTVNALVAKLTDANQALALKAATTADRKTATSLDLLDPASLPRNPTYPNRWQIAFAGLGAGALIGILAVMFRRKYGVR